MNQRPVRKITLDASSVFHQVDREFAFNNACNDWVKDNVGGGKTMSYDLFLASMFELASLAYRSHAARR